MTKTSLLLYVEDSYLREFEAKVVRAGPKFVVLDRTAFYPESGGQPSDTGIMNTDSESVKVYKVMKRGRDIFHYLERELSVGATIRGRIDWEKRFYNMRRHSAEHLLTEIFKEAATGPKVFSNLERLEFKPSSLEEETIEKVKAKFDEVVKENMPLRVFYVDREKFDVGSDKRRRSFLENIPRNVDKLRMVEISGYEPTFCFGTHVRSTGEIGKLAELKLKKGKKQRRVVFFVLKEKIRF